MVTSDNIRILVVEDDEEMRIVLDKMLSKEGYKVVLAEHGKAALEILDKDKDISLVISDIRMPECNGMQMLAKARENNPGLPIIMITAFHDVDQYMECMDTGAFEYLAKPFKNQELLDVINKVMKKISASR